MAMDWIQKGNEFKMIEIVLEFIKGSQKEFRPK